MENTQSKITSKGQLTVPQAVRRALGLVRGSEVTFVVDDNRRAVMTPKPRRLSQLWALVPARAKRQRMSLADMEDAIRLGAARDSL